MVTHQLQVERRTAKVHRPKTNALPLDHATSATSPPEFAVGDANANCPPPRIFKTYRSEFTKRHHLKGKFFFPGRGLDPSQDPFPGGPHSSLPNKPSGSASASRRIPAISAPICREVNEDGSCHCKGYGTEYQQRRVFFFTARRFSSTVKKFFIPAIIS